MTCFRDGTVTLRSKRRLTGYTEATNFSHWQRVQPGDLVVHQMDAFAGAVGVSDSFGRCSPIYAVCVPKDGVSARYFAYLIREMARSGWVTALSRGIRVRSTDFRFSTLAKQLLPVPPASEQMLIVRYLENAELRIARAINAKKQMADLLRELRAVKSETWLIRGGRPDQCSTKASLSQLGPTPDSWGLAPCRYLFREVTRRDIADSDVKLSLSLTKGLIRSSNLSMKSAAESDRLKYKRCDPGDIVLNKYRAYLGAFAVAYERGKITPNYTVLAPQTQLDSQYFASLYSTPAYQAVWRQASYGVGDGMMPLYTSNFYSVMSLLPPPDEIQRVLTGLRADTKATDMALASVEQEIELLQEFRTRLISDVVTGKKDVRAAAHGMKDVDPAELATVLAGSSSEVDDSSDEVRADGD